MKNIHVLPTDKPSEFYSIDGKHKLANSTMAMDWYISSIGYKPHNIYITSDEEIREGDFSFYSPFGVGKNIVIDGELCFHIESKNGKGSFTQRTYQTLDSNKKIILTTDQDLIKDGVQAIDDEFLEWFVKNPSCEFVEVENHYRVKSGTIREHLDGVAGYEYYEYKIIIPQEKTKQETLEEAAERLYPYEVGYGVFDRNCEIDVERERFIKGAKWQQERSYSEEEVKQILLECPWILNSSKLKWFKQFKKK